MAFYLGDNLPTMYLGENAPSIYLGEEKVYPLGPFEGLKISKSRSILALGGDLEITVQSSESWTLSCDADWITLSQNSGEAGKYKITVSVDEYEDGSEDRTTQIIATSANYSATCIVTQYLSTGYLFVDSTNYSSSFDFKSYAFVTDYYPNENTEVEFEFKFTRGIGDVWYKLIGDGVGNDASQNGIVVGCPSGNRYEYAFRGSSGYMGVSPTTLNTIIIKNGEFRVNDTVAAFEPKTAFSSTSNMVFGSQGRNGGEWVRGSLGYWGRITIKENGVVVRDYIPKEVDGEAGFYEMITKTFLSMQTSNNTLYTQIVASVPE